MEFTSIEEIKEYFGIETDNIKDLKKELKELLKDIHSDKTGGGYKSGRQKKEHEELTSALNFINNSSAEIAITNKEWTSIQKQINQLKKFKDEASFANSQKFSKQLTDSIQSSNIIFQKKHFTIKLSSVLLTSVISALWIFPSIAEKHPILKQIVISYRLPYTFIWLGSILITAVLWIYTKGIEKKDLQLKETFNLDSIQNNVFRFFLVWLRIGYHREKFEYDFDSENTKYIYTFSRDDLYNFILNYYYYLNSEFSDISNYIVSDLHTEVSEKYKSSKEILKIPNKKIPIYSRIYRKFFKVPGEIDTDLANKISDVMIMKLIERDVISKNNKGIFNDTYTYIEER